MGYQDSEYRGDKAYSLRATGDCCVGDKIRFDRATFTGSYRNAKFAGFERISGEIVRDSYGAERQQHTFTIRLTASVAKRLGQKELRVKGRNLYRHGVYRKPWADEAARRTALDEKHNRGTAARSARRARIDDRETFNACF